LTATVAGLIAYRVGVDVGAVPVVKPYKIPLGENWISAQAAIIPVLPTRVRAAFDVETVYRLPESQSTAYSCAFALDVQLEMRRTVIPMRK
jgi:hypothetical protein